MTADDDVVRELAALGREHRREPVDLEETLRRCGATHEQVAAREAGRALVELSRVFAARIARAAAGGVALLATCALVVVQFTYQGDRESPPGPEFLDATVPRVGVLIAALALVAHIFGAAVAARRFERRLAVARDRPAVARQLVARAGAPSLALGIAGSVAAITLLASVWFTIHGRWNWLYRVDSAEASVIAARFRDVAISTGASIGIAIAIARSAGRPAFAHWSVIPLGAVIGLVTLYIGFRFDVGHLALTRHPSEALRGMLTVSGVSALILVVGGLAVRRLRAENARCGLDSGATGGAR